MLLTVVRWKVAFVPVQLFDRNSVPFRFRQVPNGAVQEVLRAVVENVRVVAAQLFMVVSVPLWPASSVLCPLQALLPRVVVQVLVVLVHTFRRTKVPL